MTKDEHKAWLDGLKPGDTVVSAYKADHPTYEWVATVVFWALLFSGFILAGIDLAVWQVTGQTLTPIDWMGPLGAWLMAVNTSAVVAVMFALASA